MTTPPQCRCVRSAWLQQCMLLSSVLAGGLCSSLQAAEPAAAPVSAPASPFEKKAAADFDLDILKERGIDPQIAEYFREAPRFRPGLSTVSLLVNGQRRGRLDVRFNDKGELCFDKDLLDQGGLRIPEQTLAAEQSGKKDGAAQKAAAPPLCYDYKSAYPQTVIELRPGKEEIGLLVPTAALRPAEHDFSGFSSGGKAIILNYDVLGLNNRYSGGSGRFISANAELGFNLDDWIVRTREVYSAQDGKSQRQHLFAYGQRTLVDYKTIVQAGQINIANLAFGGAITGMQWMPESALQNSDKNNVMVEGIAQSQARVEVRQSGALIYSTAVPGGPFALTDLPLLSGVSDLEVSVTEANGAQRRFTVPAASLHNGLLGSQRGYSLAVGKLRSLGNSNARQPWIVTGSGGWRLGKDSNLSAGIMSAASYQAVSWGMDTRVLSNTSLSVQQRLSNAMREGARGTQLSLSGSSILDAGLFAGASAMLQTPGYRDPGDTTLDVRNRTEWSNARYRAQYTASLGWSDVRFGGLNISWSRSTQFSGAGTQRMIGSWGNTFGFGTLSLNVEHAMGGGSGTAGANTFYLTLSVPLGKRSVRSYVNNGSGSARFGASLNEQVNDYAGYSVSADRSTQTRETDWSGQLSILPRYAQTNFGYARSGNGSTSYSGGVRGGIVLHQQGLTLSPYPVQDTFGVLSVGNVAGVKVSTPNGPVWTDPWGQAVISQLPPYLSSRVEIATKSLPRNVDIKNGFKIVDAGRGSVNFIHFDVVTVRRILLNATLTDGREVPKGAFVLDADKQFITTVVDGGQIFLINGVPDSELHVSLEDGKSCTLYFAIPANPNPDMFFEAADAVCWPSLQVHSKDMKKHDS